MWLSYDESTKFFVKVKSVGQSCIYRLIVHAKYINTRAFMSYIEFVRSESGQVAKSIAFDIILSDHVSKRPIIMLNKP